MLEMLNRVRSKKHRQRQRTTRFILLALLLLWSLLMGWGLARVAYSAGVPLSTLAQASSANIGTVDPVPDGLQLGQELYRENCATCHIALPPAVMPTETWRRLLQDPQHYGVQLNLPATPSLVLVWNYLRAFSRPQFADEKLAYKLNESRYFKALHPRVKLPQPIAVSTCISCHPGAGEYNFRSLTSEWQDSP